MPRLKARKIAAAIAKAGDKTGEFDAEEAKILTQQVMEKIVALPNEMRLHVELVQDLVEDVLLSSPYKQTAKAYILYRDKHAQTRRRDLFKPRQS